MLLRSLSIALGLWCCAARPSFGQATAESGRIVGTIRDSASGRPLVRAFVTAGLMNGREQTDLRGRFSLGHVTPGVQDFELHCPSRTALGRQLLVKRIRVPARDSIVMDLLIDASLCDEPPYRELNGEFRGFYSTGFEHSAFLLCADPARAILQRPVRAGNDGWSDVTAWVSFTPRGLEDWRRLQGTAAADSARAVELRGFGSRYVRWQGELRGPGIYGHMGVSAYEITVDRVLYLGAGDSRVCLQPPDGKR